jgi:radical SAM superfamily enzyme YgiQ (UPF0313 family)
MPIIEPAIRPPAEAYSFLLQITTGCSANTCTFCGAYKGKEFKFKDLEEIYQDIESERKHEPRTRKVFLMDGDALVMSNKIIVPILKRLKTVFPKLTRVSSYANGYNIVKRTKAELDELCNHHLKLIYIGLESGSENILRISKKKSSAQEMVDAVRMASDSGIKSSVIVLLGLGGKKHSKEHVAETIKALNKMQPMYLSFLSLMLVPGTELYKSKKSGDFEELKPKDLLEEAHDILAGLELDKTIFRCNHASNYFNLEGRLPTDKDRLLQELGQAINGTVGLRSEFFRGL